MTTLCHNPFFQKTNIAYEVDVKRIEIALKVILGEDVVRKEQPRIICAVTLSFKKPTLLTKSSLYEKGPTSRAFMMMLMLEPRAGAATLCHNPPYR